MHDKQIISKNDNRNNLAFVLGFKLALFVFIILVIYLAMDNKLNTGIKIILILVAYFMLLSSDCYDCCNCNQCNDKYEPFSRFAYEYEKPEGLTRRQTRLYNLNKDRGFLGQFHVGCHKCGRSRIIEERKKAMQDCSKTNDGYCINNCNDGVDKRTMSFFNDNYIDKDAIFCYRCSLDNDAKRQMRNYRNFPYINGPPENNNYMF